MKGKLKGALAFIHHHEASGGIVLFAAAVTALLLANSPIGPAREELLHLEVGFHAGSIWLEKSLLHWINDGLMAIFFFLVGLEIKRELLIGELSRLKQASLPLFAAIGGMIVPALIYLVFNYTDPQAIAGWAIPSATDIAFAVGVMALLGSRVPAALKIVLLALAIIDDLGAIIIIALFYTAGLSMPALMLAGTGIVVLAILNQRGVTSVAPYVLAGIFIWACVLKSGVHATLAGVVTALAIPLNEREESGSLATELQERLHPWVTFAVLPLFAFANAGVSLAGVTWQTAMGPIPLGIALGLIIGKPLGIFTFSMLAIAAGVARLPDGVRGVQLLGVGILAGIGFTMSLFIGTLAFPDPAYGAQVRLGVLGGSVVSAIAGYVLLSRVAKQANRAV